MMATLRRWMRFPHRERRMLLAAAALQVVFSVLLRIVSFRRMTASVTAPRVEPHAAPDIAVVGRWLWAIDATGRHLGAASSCLARALAARWIARRTGVDLPISIGVARGASNSFDAHAWIAGAHDLHLGAAAAARYVPLLTVDDGSQP
jgi:hypothetical protein